MTDITLFELLTRLPDLQSCRGEFGWGWVFLEVRLPGD